MPKERKKLLVLISHGAYSSEHNAAALDMLLAGGLNHFNVSAVFCNEGVCSLLKNQQAQRLQATDLSQTWRALPVYDINKIYVLENSLMERDLSIDDLTLFVKLLQPKQLATLLQQQDFILRY